MGARYVAFSLADFEPFMKEMGFHITPDPNAWEYVFEHVIAPDADRYPDFPQNRFAIRVHSSIDRSTKLTRDVGTDAIRVSLVDKKTNRGHRAFTRVHRTINARSNMRLRCREAWKAVVGKTAICDRCSSLMVERSTVRNGKKEKFLGCSGFDKNNPQSCRRIYPFPADNS